MRGADHLNQPGFIAVIIPLVGLMLLVIAGAAAYATIGGDTPNQTANNQFSFVNGDEIFSGTGFRGELTPPLKPEQFEKTNDVDNKPHGKPGHGVFMVTCRNSGAIDYIPNTANEVGVYAVKAGEVAMIRKTYIMPKGNTGSILELRHEGSPSCSNYSHIDIADNIIAAVVDNGLTFGNVSTRIPANVHINVAQGQKIGRIAHPRASFSYHLHFQLDGANERQLQQAMQQLSAAAKVNKPAP